MRRADSWVKAGVALVAAAVAGWLVTTVALSFAARPTGVEDLTAVWQAAAPTALGEEAAVRVPAGSTLVAFVVGTDLRGLAGTTAGRCTAASDGRPLSLDWPVHINPSLTGVLADRQEVVAVAGWTNTATRPAEVTVRCRAADSGVEHVVAVPSATARLESDPWFQPWAWLALGAVGAGLAATGLTRR